MENESHSRGPLLYAVEATACAICSWQYNNMEPIRLQTPQYGAHCSWKPQLTVCHV